MRIATLTRTPRTSGQKLDEVEDFNLFVLRQSSQPLDQFRVPHVSLLWCHENRPIDLSLCHLQPAESKDRTKVTGSKQALMSFFVTIAMLHQSIPSVSPKAIWPEAAWILDLTHFLPGANSKNPAVR
jgi:hypothetical protein